MQGTPRQHFTVYLLPNLNTIPYMFKARFNVTNISCNTTELSKLLTSCFSAGKSHVIMYHESVLKYVCEELSKLKCKGFGVTSLSTFDFLPFIQHYFIIQLKKHLLILLNITSKGNVRIILPVTIERL